MNLFEDYMEKEQLAAELKQSVRSLDRMEKLGIGPPRTLIGRKVLYRKTSVLDWLAAREQRHPKQNRGSRQR